MDANFLMLCDDWFIDSLSPGLRTAIERCIVLGKTRDQVLATVRAASHGNENVVFACAAFLDRVDAIRKMCPSDE